jgi:hypothetical protein
MNLCRNYDDWLQNGNPLDDAPSYFDVMLSDEANEIFKQLNEPYFSAAKDEINSRYYQERDAVDDSGIARGWLDEQTNDAERLSWKLPLLAFWNY